MIEMEDDRHLRPSRGKMHKRGTAGSDAPAATRKAPGPAPVERFAFLPGHPLARSHAVVERERPLVPAFSGSAYRLPPFDAPDSSAAVRKRRVLWALWFRCVFVPWRNESEWLSAEYEDMLTLVNRWARSTRVHELAVAHFVKRVAFYVAGPPSESAKLASELFLSYRSSNSDELPRRANNGNNSNDSKNRFRPEGAQPGEKVYAEWSQLTHCMSSFDARSAAADSALSIRLFYERYGALHPTTDEDKATHEQSVAEAARDQRLVLGGLPRIEFANEKQALELLDRADRARKELTPGVQATLNGRISASHLHDLRAVNDGSNDDDNNNSSNRPLQQQQQPLALVRRSKAQVDAEVQHHLRHLSREQRDVAEFILGLVRGDSDTDTS